jgi:hypothetical protein
MPTVVTVDSDCTVNGIVIKKGTPVDFNRNGSVYAVPAFEENMGLNGIRCNNRLSFLGRGRTIGRLTRDTTLNASPFRLENPWNLNMCHINGSSSYVRAILPTIHGLMVISTKAGRKSGFMKAAP